MRNYIFGIKMLLINIYEFIKALPIYLLELIIMVPIIGLLVIINKYFVKPGKPAENVWEASEPQSMLNDIFI